jgi:hypothetical protein
MSGHCPPLGPKSSRAYVAAWFHVWGGHGDKRCIMIWNLESGRNRSQDWRKRLVEKGMPDTWAINQGMSWALHVLPPCPLANRSPCPLSSASCEVYTRGLHRNRTNRRHTHAHIHDGVMGISSHDCADGEVLPSTLQAGASGKLVLSKGLRAKSSCLTARVVLAQESSHHSSAFLFCEELDLLTWARGGRLCPV